MSNRPFLPTVSNCPRCQIVRGVKLSGVKLSGVKLSAVSNCPRCQIVLVSNCPPTNYNNDNDDDNDDDNDNDSAARPRLPLCH